MFLKETIILIIQETLLQVDVILRQLHSKHQKNTYIEEIENHCYLDSEDIPSQ